MAKNVYFDPFLGYRGNQMKYRADVVESQLEQNSARAKDIMAAKEVTKRRKRGPFARFFARKNHKITPTKREK